MTEPRTLWLYSDEAVSDPARFLDITRQDDAIDVYGPPTLDNEDRDWLGYHVERMVATQLPE